MSTDPTTVTLIAAVARDGIIGAGGGLPWHLPADLERFKALTMGHPMIMGRRTFDSIGRALPGRRTIVVTRDPAWQATGVQVAHSVPEALAMAGPSIEVMVVGGGEIYRQLIGRADRLEITRLDADVVGDTRFPTIDPAIWRVVDHQDADGYSFVSYRRREPVRDLTVLLSSLEPHLHDGEFVFCALAAGAEPPAGLRPVVIVEEEEGTTLVLPAEQAAAAGLPGSIRTAWITLTVSSALDGVGLTAAVSTALARDGIACNVIAGYHHDHLFVPIDAATAAMAALAHTRS
ncbi:MAG TPA: ACT domain-containing protein [Nakamurella sp.]